jgi:hypothetical protein
MCPARPQMNESVRNWAWSRYCCSCVTALRRQVCFSSARIRAASADAVPGRVPRSICACSAQPRSVSALIPSSAPTFRHAAGTLVPCSFTWSTPGGSPDHAARPDTSVLLPSSHSPVDWEPPQNPGRFSTPWSRASSSAGLTSAAPTWAGSRRCPRSRPASTSTLPPGNREVIRRSHRRSARGESRRGRYAARTPRSCAGRSAARRDPAVLRAPPTPDTARPRGGPPDQGPGGTYPGDPGRPASQPPRRKADLPGPMCGLWLTSAVHPEHSRRGRSHG